jgi:hypothetical protein
LSLRSESPSDLSCGHAPANISYLEGTPPRILFVLGNSSLEKRGVAFRSIDPLVTLMMKDDGTGAVGERVATSVNEILMNGSGEPRIALKLVNSTNTAGAETRVVDSWTPRHLWQGRADRLEFTWPTSNESFIGVDPEYCGTDTAASH